MAALIQHRFVFHFEIFKSTHYMLLLGGSRFRLFQTFEYLPDWIDRVVALIEAVSEDYDGRIIP